MSPEKLAALFLGFFTPDKGELAPSLWLEGALGEWVRAWAPESGALLKSLICVAWSKCIYLSEPLCAPLSKGVSCNEQECY